MNENYTGWDGKPYPWPPPEGWYEASDGRWWAPGTGPNPPGAEGPGGVQGSGPAPEQEPTVAQDIARTAQLPADATPSSPGAAAGTAGVTVASDAGHASAGAPPPSLAGSPGGSADDGWATNQWESAPDTSPGTPEDRSLAATVGLVLAGVVAALAVAAGAYFVLRDDGSETAADGSTTTADSGTTSTVDGSSSTTDGATTTSGSTSTSGDEPTSTSDGTSTTADTPAQVLEFRGILTENGLTSTGLSDEDIATFGTRFCVFAIASESEAEYEDFRQQAIETTTSDLSDEELFTVVDAAVVVFCPDEAARLGIES